MSLVKLLMDDLEYLFNKKPEGYKPPPATEVVKRTGQKKSLSVTLVSDEEKLEAIQKFYGGTLEAAVMQFINSQMCGQFTTDKVEVIGSPTTI